MNFEVGIVVRTTFILLFVSLVSLVFRRASASARHAIWAFGLLAVLALPVATKMLPMVDLPILPAATSAENSNPTTITPVATSRTSDFQIVEPVAGPKIQSTSVATPSIPVRYPGRQTLQQLALMVWGLGSCVVFLGWLIALLELRKLKRRSRPLVGMDWTEVMTDVQRELSVTEPVQLRIAETPAPPMTWGIFRHVILLPDSASEWSPVRRRLVIAHEMAHVKRNDGLGQILAQAVCSIYWFNPIVWYAVHRFQTERERACDDTVLRLGAAPLDYADHLVQIARGLNSGFAMTAVSMANPSQLKARVQAILDSATDRRRLPRLTAALLLFFIGALTLSAATIQVTALAGMAIPSFKAPLGTPAWLAALVGRTSQESPALPASLAAVIPDPEHPTTASVEGVVQIAGSGKAISAAGVELSRVNGGQSKPYTVATSDDGRYVFQDIPAGEYRLAAARNGFVRSEYGQRGPNSRGITITLAAGQAMKDARIVLIETASISGHIYDRKGAPMANVQVQALRYAYEDGRRVLRTMRALITDDEGVYRLYWLPPAQYFVMATPLLGDLPNDVIVSIGNGGTGHRPAMPSMGASILLPDATGNTPYFYPGTVDVQNAKSIDLRPGDDVSTIDMTINTLPTRTVRGKVSNLPVPSDTGIGSGLDGYVHLASITPSAFDRATSPPNLGAFDKKTGVFEIRGVLPGKYDVLANVSTYGRNAVSRTGRVSIEVTNSDVDNVALALVPGFDLPLHVSIDGRPANSESPELPALEVMLNPDYTGPASPLSPGSFIVRGVSARDYEIRIAGLPNNAYVKSIRMGDTDISEKFHVERTPDAPVEISISLNGGAVSGTVTGRISQSLENITVVLVPGSPRRQRVDLYKSALTDASGQFRFSGLTPGDYKLFAWEDVENGAWQAPDFIREYEDLGKSLRIEEGSALTIPVTVIQ